MLWRLLGIALALATLFAEVHATVVPIPGASPQRSFPRVSFPNPIGVLITDGEGRPVEGARARFRDSFGTGPFLNLYDTAACFWDVGVNCSWPADARGIAMLPDIQLTHAGRHLLKIQATGPKGEPLGSTEIELTADSPAAAVTLHKVAGDGQRAMIGTPYPTPLTVRLLHPDGSPVANAPVHFSAGRSGLPLGPVVHFSQVKLPRHWWQAHTDANGYASTPIFSAGWGVGSGSVMAFHFDERAGVAATAHFGFTNLNEAGEESLRLEGLWWGGPAQSGWALAIHQYGDLLLSFLLGYDRAGSPTWVTMAESSWDEGLGSDLFLPASITRGTPYFAYDASRLAHMSAGTVRLMFRGEHKAVMREGVNIDGPHGYLDRSLERFDFSEANGEPERGVGGLWWGGPTQSGWALSIMEQPGQLFCTWLTYDEAGRPTWLMPSGRWLSSDTFEGRVYRTRGSPFFGATYDPSALSVSDVGSFRLQFRDSTARFHYDVDGRRGTLELTRYSPG